MCFQNTSCLATLLVCVLSPTSVASCRGPTQSCGRAGYASLHCWFVTFKGAAGYEQICNGFEKKHTNTDILRVPASGGSETIVKYVSNLVNLIIA